MNRPSYQKGSKRPPGYIERSDWAEDQAAHGLRQTQCVHCRLFRFPQEYPCCLEDGMLFALIVCVGNTDGVFGRFFSIRCHSYKTQEN